MRFRCQPRPFVVHLANPFFGLFAIYRDLLAALSHKMSFAAIQAMFFITAVARIRFAFHEAAPHQTPFASLINHNLLHPKTYSVAAATIANGGDNMKYTHRCSLARARHTWPFYAGQESTLSWKMARLVYCGCDVHQRQPG